MKRDFGKEPKSEYRVTFRETVAWGCLQAHAHLGP